MRTCLLLSPAPIWLTLAAMLATADQCAAQLAPTIDTIVERLSDIERTFFQSESLRLLYERTASRDLEASAVSGQLSPAEWQFAYRGDKWFLERRFTKPMKTPSLVIPGQPTTIVIKDGVLLEWMQDAQSATVAPFRLGINSYQGLNYTRALSLDAPKYIARSGGADLAQVRKKYPDHAGLPFLPEFLIANKDHYRVSTNQEMVEGVKCWIVQWPGMDRIALDPERGFALVSRSYHWGPGKPARSRFVNSGFREVQPGLWLPFAVTETTFASIHAEQQTLWGKATALSEYKVKSIEFNQVPDSLFDVRLSPNTRVIDTVRKLQYSTPANPDADALSDALAEAILQSRSRGALVKWIVIGAGIALVICAALYWRWRRTRSMA